MIEINILLSRLRGLDVYDFQTSIYTRRPQNVRASSASEGGILTIALDGDYGRVEAYAAAIKCWVEDWNNGNTFNW